MKASNKIITDREIHPTTVMEHLMHLLDYVDTQHTHIPVVGLIFG